MVPEPSIGRTVLYNDGSEESPVFLPAIITNVWNATCVNLTVFLDDGTGATRGVTSSTLGPKATEWSWPKKS